MVFKTKQKQITDLFKNLNLESISRPVKIQKVKLSESVNCVDKDTFSELVIWLNNNKGLLVYGCQYCDSIFVELIERK